MVAFGAVVLAGLFSRPTDAPTAPPVQTPGSSIAITTCHAQLDPPPLRIAYSNTAKVTATEVHFVILGDVGVIETVADRGSFAPGEPINKVFRLPIDVSPLGLHSVKCIVTKVLYADGTTWTNPSPP
jgi:hypothetical protein